jgi:hypothetical protein
VSVAHASRQADPATEQTPQDTDPPRPRRSVQLHLATARACDRQGPWHHFGCRPSDLSVKQYLITMVTGLCEAYPFAEPGGVDVQLFRAILRARPMAGAVSQGKPQKAVAGDLSVQTAITDVLKNKRLAAASGWIRAFARPQGVRRQGVEPRGRLPPLLFRAAETRGTRRPDLTIEVARLALQYTVQAWNSPHDSSPAASVGTAPCRGVRDSTGQLPTGPAQEVGEERPHLRGGAVGGIPPAFSSTLIRIGHGIEARNPRQSVTHEHV